MDLNLHFLFLSKTERTVSMVTSWEQKNSAFEIWYAQPIESKNNKKNTTIIAYSFNH